MPLTRPLTGRTALITGASRRIGNIPIIDILPRHPMGHLRHGAQAQRG